MLRLEKPLYLFYGTYKMQDTTLISTVLCSFTQSPPFYSFYIDRNTHLSSPVFFVAFLLLLCYPLIKGRGANDLR